MRKQIITTDRAPKPVRPYYSQGVVVKPGRLIFVAGQAWWPGDGRPFKGDVRAQAQYAINNIKAILESQGATLEDVVRITVYMTNIEEHEKLTDLRTKYFGTSPPASALIGVCKLAHEDILVEIDAIAVIE